MTAKNLEVFLENSPHLKCAAIGGGEPMILKELEKITRIIIDATSPDLLVTITNGSRPNKVASFINTALDSDIDTLFVGVSIDGIGYLCDENRAKGSYENAIKTLKLVSELQEEDPRIVPNVSFTILPNNYMELLKVFYLALSYKASFNYRIAMPYDKFTLTEEMLREIERQQKIIIRMMEKPDLARSVIDFNIRYIKGVIPHYRTGERPYPCQVPLLNINVDPWGDIYPCNDAPWLTGEYGNDIYKSWNIKEGSLKDFLFSERRMKAAQLLENCNRCWSECSYHTIAPEYLEGLKIFRP